jgi:aspartyl-tRNA(Asn)/glutamyl-tRNA(Gln) amidotransferase subunit C
MAISREDVEHIANLSRIRIREEEKDSFIKSFSEVLEHVKNISKISTDGVEPCHNVFPLKNVLREDEAKPSYPPEKLLENAPEKEDTAYLVPKVVE